jgi:hypothetical protein
MAKNGEFSRLFWWPGKFFWVPVGISQQMRQFWKGYWILKVIEFVVKF